ncbi:hypothetical protein V5O48_013717 [Marasmius crinis-equi]|uniref:Eukaryotic translation initiation factor 2D-like PUA RNA-binding domain-containing protein n=1 Tax=Marasmius crinis-equi TaxID=585013 RepID=A0ABR3EZD9_9AGAR
MHIDDKKPADDDEDPYSLFFWAFAEGCTHLNELGVAYLAPNGDPLWFTIGKGSDNSDLIPTVYTLWKSPKLLPFLSTPKAVIPILVGGADLMIPGVVHHTPDLKEGQLVSVCEYERHEGVPTLSPLLAVGRMAVSSDQLAGDEKGKAVFEDVAIQTTETTDEQPAEVTDVANALEDLSTNDSPPTYTYTPDEISTLLHKSLLQALSTSLSQLPPSAFPIPSTQFNTSHILPARPNFPSLVTLPPLLPPLLSRPFHPTPFVRRTISFRTSRRIEEHGTFLVSLSFRYWINRDVPPSRSSVF